MFEAKTKKVLPVKKAKSVVLTQFFNNKKRDSNSDDDFSKVNTPVKRSPSPQLPPPQSRLPIKRTRKRQGDIRKMIKPTEDELLTKMLAEHCQDEDLNPDDVQMAIALSKSEMPSTSSMDDTEFADLRQKYSKAKRTLEGYGFKCKNNYADYDIQALFGPSKARKRHSKPTLLTKRDQKRQETLTAEKAQIIIDLEYKENIAVPIHPHPKWECYSFYTDKVIGSGRLFEVNANEKFVAESKMEYHTGLFELSDIRSGYLLQNWHEIPGRERTPSPSRRNFLAFDAPLRVVDWSLPSAENPAESCEKNEVSQVWTWSDYTDSGQLKEQAQPVVMQEKLNELNNLAQSSQMNLSCEDLFADEDEIIVFHNETGTDDGRFHLFS